MMGLAEAPAYDGSLHMAETQLPCHHLMAMKWSLSLLQAAGDGRRDHKIIRDRCLTISSRLYIHRSTDISQLMFRDQLLQQLTDRYIMIIIDAQSSLCGLSDHEGHEGTSAST